MVLSLFFSELRIDVFEQTPSYGFFRLVGKLINRNFYNFVSLFTTYVLIKKSYQISIWTFLFIYFCYLKCFKIR